MFPFLNIYIYQLLQTPPQAALVIAELLPHLEDVLFAGHSGVVVKMAEAGLRATARQPEIVETLLVAFHAQNDTNTCVPLLLTLTAYEVHVEHTEKRESDINLARVSDSGSRFPMDCILFCRGMYMCKALCLCKLFSSTKIRELLSGVCSAWKWTMSCGCHVMWPAVMQ